MTIETLASAPTSDLAVPTPIGGHIAVADVTAWVERAELYGQLARRLVRSHFIPQAYKINVPPRAGQAEIDEAYAVAEANATGAMMLGGSLGLDPLTSLQQIYIVHGRPGMYAKIKVALAQAAGHEVWDETYSAERVVVCGRRKGWADDRLVRIELTIADAERAEWAKSNPNYRKTPADMLWSRAASRVVDRIASDVLHGIQSVEDIDADETTVEARPAATSVTSAAILARAAAVKAAADDASPQTVPTAEAASEPAPTKAAPPKIRQGQRDRLAAAFDGLKVTESGERTAILAAVADRVIRSSADLTAAEADTAVDQLERVAKKPTADADAWVDQQLEHAAALDQVLRTVRRGD
ncbi:hypothetical protein [Kineosporia succinea]|uniref:RecT family protein n=1 Tax=Kineosporia succinea TaxID=84632 RepID=A0ABT9P5V6_9ACTN|nr:hypothetical protein [Kineosporia succinea]MDP9828073.1 hypothetical protein [Kineosporia succinea]